MRIFYWLLIPCFIQASIAQDERLIDVKQILKDALDIIRNTPPSPELAKVGKMILPNTQSQYQVPTYNRGPATPPSLTLTTDQLRLLQKIQARERLTMEEYEQARYLNEYLKYQAVRGNQLHQGGRYPYGYPQQPGSPVIPAINRIFAAPTENDIQRLMMLPADILYKMAEEGKYIEPEHQQDTYTEERESTSTTDDSKKSDNLFGSFNFNIQGDGNNGPSGNPFLSSTTEKPAEETTTTTEKPTQQPETTTQPSEVSNSTLNENIHQNHQKPYFYYSKEKQGDNMGKWVLVVPPTENNEPPKISVAELVELSRSLVTASQRSGMNSDITELPSQLFQEPPPKEKQEKPVESNLPIASFVQEAESQVQEKEKAFSQLTPDEIMIDGKLYKLVRENTIKKKRKHKKKQTKNIQTTTTTAAPVVLHTAAPDQIKPSEPLLTDIYRHLTPEQEKIFLELQRRISQQRQEMAKMIVQQPTIPPDPTFMINQNPINVPPQQPINPQLITPQPIPNDYHRKVNIPPDVAQIPAVVAAPKIHIQQIDASTPELPLRRQYSLQELEEYYKAQKAAQEVTESTTPKPELTTPEKVFGPHKQVKIQMNSEKKSPAPTRVIQTTKVDSITDAADRERQRIAELRRQFALERQQLSQRLRSKVNRTTVLEPTTPAPSIVTEHHCYNIRSFARQSGAKDILEYAFSHCHYIENYYPDLKCENVKDYMAVLIAEPIMSSKCTICDGNSDGYHFGVAACRACSSFFRRTIAENKEYRCRKSGACNVSQNYRNVCRACRLQRCYQMGMKRQAIEHLKKSSDESDNVLSSEISSRSLSPLVNNSIESTKYLKTFETIWKTFVSSLKSLYTVQHPTSIFSVVKASEYKLITKSEYDKLEKATISFLFSLFGEHIPPFAKIPHEDRITILRSVTRGISMLFKAMMTANVFPDDDDKIVMACGYYVNKKNLDHFFEKSEGYESATKLFLPVFKNVRQLSADVKTYRDVDMGTIVVLLLSQKLRQMGISSEDDEVYWKDALAEAHVEHVKTFGLHEGGIKFAELLLNLLTITNIVNQLNESITMAKIFCPDNLMDVWHNIYST